MLLSPASQPKRPPQPTSALALWALGLGLGAVVAAGSLLLALLTGPRVDRVAPPVIELALVAVPAIALAAVIVGIVATVRTARRGHRVWMAITGLAVGVVMLVVWPGAFLSVMIAYSLSGIGG